MPIYEYQCKVCGKEVELLQKMNDKPPICCIESKDKTMGGEMKRKVSNIAPPVFKGSGFYATDYKKKGYSKPDKKVEKSEDKKSEGNKKKQK
jgi:putative FmdB family regulatory protein|tara:strand:- start:194 stop:469 length:276 start_codon:yes stop_codon:yes gene_type:complete